MGDQLNFDFVSKFSGSLQNNGPVTCLGMTFENDEARRTHFTEELRKKIQDPEFLKIEGFPVGSHEEILRLSDPPYYCACPNPWIANFITEWESQKPGPPEDVQYHREPLDIEINESRNNKYVNAHSYATKTPHQAIMRFLLHYTKPGDIILDLFGGTGMTAVAAQLCENPEDKFRKLLESENIEISWGGRNVIVGDLGVAPTFISRNLNTPDDELAFKKEISEIASKIESELGWMYKTKGSNGQDVNITATIWSDYFICSDCSMEFSYWDAAVDVNKGSVASKIVCPHCGAVNNKSKLTKSWASEYDPVLNKVIQRVKSMPMTIIYDYNRKRYEKTPDDNDLEIIERINSYKIPYWIPRIEMPHGFNTDQPKRSHGLTHVHHFLRNAIWLYWHALGVLRRVKGQSFYLHH
jgi:DNA-directed RNA polymerase subunit RPC12/RpoP